MILETQITQADPHRSGALPYLNGPIAKSGKNVEKLIA